MSDSMPPNNRMERGLTHKVPRRGRVGSVVEQVMRARVREALACARSCERSAALPSSAGSTKIYMAYVRA
jgi:hypothetical protein